MYHDDNKMSFDDLSSATIRWCSSPTSAQSSFWFRLILARASWQNKMEKCWLSFSSRDKYFNRGCQRNEIFQPLPCS